ncbi:MAG: hypothetical protein NUV60_02885 [Patescibacteria group bacterium]|nr:hypothetical protein [Patescibacteria group bacterium]
MQRDTHIIIGLALVALAIGVFFLARFRTASDTPSAVANIQPSAVIVPFTKIVSGEKSTVTERVNYLITSSDELTKLWKMVDATGTPPTVDFNTQNVIAVFAGKESTSSIAVAKIEDTNARVVSVTLTKPDGACATELTAPAPYEIVVVAVTTLPLAHEDLAATAGCPN